MSRKRDRNRLKPGVIGDTGDVRTIGLEGVADLVNVNTVDARFENNDGTIIEVPGTVKYEQPDGDRPPAVEVQVGTMLTDPTCTVETWGTDVVLDKGLPSELTWPAREKAEFPVRDRI